MKNRTEGMHKVTFELEKISAQKYGDISSFSTKTTNINTKKNDHDQNTDFLSVHEGDINQDPWVRTSDRDPGVFPDSFGKTARRYMSWRPLSVWKWSRQQRNEEIASRWCLSNQDPVSLQYWVSSLWTTVREVLRIWARRNVEQWRRWFSSFIDYKIYPLCRNKRRWQGTHDLWDIFSRRTGCVVSICVCRYWYHGYAWNDNILTIYLWIRD